MSDVKMDVVSSMKIPCCPELLRDDNCDTLFFTRTLNYPFFYKDIRLTVQLILGFRLKRCTLGLTLGAPVYSTTLLPGEKVRLFTTDRRSSFTYDASTKLSYRSEQISEEQYFMRASQSYFSDMEAEQSGGSSSTNKNHWDFKGSSDTSIDINPFSPGVGTSNSSSQNHDSSSTLDYLNRQSANMKSAATQAVNSTHRAHSISVGEVATRVHVEGESEDHFESSSREYQNLNDCHAVTYIFYRLNKKQVLTFELVSIEKTITAAGSPNIAGFNPTISPELRAEILKALDKELQTAGLIDKDGNPGAELKKKFDFKLEFSLPTAGIIVKGCLDECNTCEPARRERVNLENQMYKKKIELLEKSQEYRCCPCDSEEGEPPV